MKKIKKRFLGFIILFGIIFTLFCLYFIAFIWAGLFSESIDTQIIVIDKNMELGQVYDENTFDKLSGATNNEINGTRLGAIYIKYDESGAPLQTLYIYHKDYTFISDWFVTKYTPVKVVQIHYNNVSEIVEEMTVSIGNSLLVPSQYKDEEEWVYMDIENRSQIP